ncbi:hypothetical protein LCGC14_2526930 [marine sediment metagenome]|uniref:Uncharacterized protein n=1 Tax=marine sediment metagenome TaxID=412755 RepID=A0A0F9D6B4_9ZZZZ
MGTLIILIIAVLLVPIGIGLAIWAESWTKDRKKKEGYYNFNTITSTPISNTVGITGVALAIIAVVVVVAWSIVSLINILHTYNTVQEMEAFRDGTMSAYEYTIDETQNVVIDPAGTRDGAWTDFSYQEQGLAVSERIKELRDKVEWYNAKLEKYRSWNNLWAFEGMIADIPDDWTFITIGGD